MKYDKLLYNITEYLIINQIFNILKYFGVCPIILGKTKIFLNVVFLYQNILKCTKILLNIPQNFEIFKNISAWTKISRNSLEYFYTYHNILGCVRKIQNVQEYFNFNKKIQKFIGCYNEYFYVFQSILKYTKIFWRESKYSEIYLYVSFKKWKYSKICIILLEFQYHSLHQNIMKVFRKYSRGF